MKISYQLSFLFLIIFVSSLLLFAQDLQQNSIVHEKLWLLEEEYMRSYTNKSIDKLKEYWHKEFIGWPEWADSPVNVDQALMVIGKKANNTITAFEIRPHNILVKDNIAITYYFIDLELVNDKNEKSKASYRIIHTWINESKNWKIVGGMSAKIL